MVIHKIKYEDFKGDQQWQMLRFCIYHWYIINNTKYPYYTDIMNMKTYRWSAEELNYIAITYHMEPKKW